MFVHNKGMNIDGMEARHLKGAKVTDAHKLADQLGDRGKVVFTDHGGEAGGPVCMAYAPKDVWAEASNT